MSIAYPATVAIPARLGSNRLERKVLVDIWGRTMLERTHAAAVRAEVGPVVVLTDHREVVDVVESFGGQAWLTDPALPSGTARTASVVHEFTTDVVINLQGDAPLTDPQVIVDAAREAALSGAPVTMPVYRLASASDVHDPNVTKIVRASDGRALYCSRSAVPFIRGVAAEEWPDAVTFWGPAGLYAYTREFLDLYPTLPDSELERHERLEQLRWLEAGLRLHTFETRWRGPSVNTADQLERVRAIVAEKELV